MGPGRESTGDFSILALGLMALLASAGVAISLATEPVILLWANPL